MPERRIYFTTEDVERVLDSIEDQLDEENGGILPDFPADAVQLPPYAQSRSQPYKPPCERSHPHKARELLFAVFYYAIALLAAIGLGVVANVLGGLFQ